MDRDEVLERLDRMASFWAEADTREGVENGPYTTALRAAAELIRKSGWRPIAEGTNDSFAMVGRWRRGEWNWKVTPYVRRAAEDGYTHWMPLPEPPVREVGDGTR